MTRFMLEQESQGHGQLGNSMTARLWAAGLAVETETYYPREPDEYFVECMTAEDILKVSEIMEDAVSVEWKGDDTAPVLRVLNGWRDGE